MKQRLNSYIYGIFGSFLVGYAWSWYHVSKHPWTRFLVIAVVTSVAIYAAWRVGKNVFLYAVKRFGRHIFWHNDFARFLDEFFLISSLFFGIFFFRIEVYSLVYASAVFLLLYIRTRHYLRHHPAHQNWLKVHRAFFVLGYFLFLLQAVLQFTAYHYYILDSNIRFYNIVLFRSLAMTSFWLFGFVVASFIFWSVKSWWRYLFFIIWSLFFIFGLIFWVVNIGLLYYAGLYFSPNNLEHAKGATGVLQNNLTYLLGFLVLMVTAFFIAATRHFIISHTLAARRQWLFFNIIIGVAALGSVVSLASFKNTPEHNVIKSFYNYYAGKEVNYQLDSVVKNKLGKFGLYYNPDNFYVVERKNVFSPTSTLQLLPGRFRNTKPNILIVFWESFSARLSDVYNPAFTDLTPGLDAFAADKNTTIFNKYFNASTPTITGTLSQLCSFLPPMGHNEIQNERKLQNHHLLCLPEVLKKQAGFKYAAYVTAVDKEFAHKDSIFTSMSVDKIYGTDELAKVISGKPLSWGYSDHQMFPATWKMMQTAPQPFLMMLATVDTHPPFNLAKDEVKYRDGSQPVLNSFYTTDDAFGKFWVDFKASPMYNNTIVVVVGDHAIFPGALTKDITSWPGHDDTKSQKTYYDQNVFMMYVPDNVLPKTVDVYSSGIDMLPTMLQMFKINIPNSFEGHSIFDDRKNYPSLLGMHELGLYINQINSQGKRQIDYNVPGEIKCSATASEGASQYASTSTPNLTLCEYLQFYKWKRQMFEEGRFWKQ